MDINMTTLPQISIGLRPTLSMTAMAGSVQTKKTTPVTPVARRACVPPVKPKLMKTLDA